jgi:hypothetical protein
MIVVPTQKTIDAREKRGTRESTGSGMLVTLRGTLVRKPLRRCPAPWLMNLVKVSWFQQADQSNFFKDIGVMKARDVKEQEKIKKIEQQLSLKILSPGDAGKLYFMYRILFLLSFQYCIYCLVNYPKYGDSAAV